MRWEKNRWLISLTRLLFAFLSVRWHCATQICAFDQTQIHSYATPQPYVFGLTYTHIPWHEYLHSDSCTPSSYDSGLRIICRALVCHVRNVTLNLSLAGTTLLPLASLCAHRHFTIVAWLSQRVLSRFSGHTPEFKKGPNFLNSSPTSIDGALRLLSAPSGRFWPQTAIYPVSLWALVVELHPLNWARAQAVGRINPTNAH